MNFESTYTYNQITEILHNYIPDVSYYNQSFIERRFIYICDKLHIPDIQTLIDKIREDFTFIDVFLYHLSVPVTEMYRDYSMWKYLNEQVLPDLIKKKQCVIWLPALSSGEELYSLCILLKHFKIDTITIYASHRSIYAIQQIKKGIYSLKNENLNNINFSKIGIGNSLEEYYTKSFNSIYMNASLLHNVKFINSTSILQQIPQNIDLVLFRNNLLYYDKQMHHIIISEIAKNINKGGYLILGLNDNNAIENYSELFKTENEDERIYKKK